MSADVPVDKVHIAAFYDENNGVCYSIEVALNTDAVSREDVASAIQALFHPQALLSSTTTTFRHTELGGTAVIPRAGETPAPVPQIGQRARFSVDGRPVWPLNSTPVAPPPSNPRRG